MTSTDFRRVVEIVDAALDHDHATRSDFLDRACADSPELRAEVESLLAEEESALTDDFLEVPGALKAMGLLSDPKRAPATDEVAAQAPPAAIGPYRILGELGRGGMGTVYLAEQSEPIERRVALKVIHRFGGEREKQRFASECRALARLKHPNVAAIYDAGVADDGTAFVAMEWIEGSHITDWCDDRRLQLRDRIRLFLGVCRGVAHAHQKGLVHRDLKPSNVLVAEVDGTAVAKVIDFGIARTLEETDTPAMGSHSANTPSRVAKISELSQLMGSPMYMSPEAADLSERADVDTRTDVYSLGVLLYELLSGVLPHEDPEFGAVALLRRSSTTDAPMPSRRWADLDRQDQARISEHRRTRPTSMARLLRGDLDAILGRAMARDREARYDGVSDLAADLNRHLERRAVYARSSSLPYRTGRLLRRNVGTVTAGLLIIGALAAGFVARTREAQRANQEAVRAQEALSEAEQVSEFLIGLFEVVDPDRRAGDPQSVDELLTKAQTTMSEELADQPLARARFLQTLGRIALNRSELSKAATLYEESVALREAHGPPDSQETVVAVGSLGVVYRRQGRFEEAEEQLTRAVRMSEVAGQRDEARYAATITWLANLHFSQSRHEEAIQGHRKALAIRREKLPDQLGAIGESLNNLGTALRQNGQFIEAHPILREAENYFSRALGPQHPLVVGTWLNLAGIEERLGRWQEAEELLIRAGNAWTEIYGSDHPRTLLARRALGALWRRWRRSDEAAAHLSALLEEQLRGTAGSRPLELARTRVELGYSLLDLGQHDRSQRVLEQALEAYLSSPESPTRTSNTISIRTRLALLAHERGDTAGTVPSLSQLSQEALASLGERRTITGWVFLQLGTIQTELGLLDEAESSFRQARRTYELIFGQPTLDSARLLRQLGRLREREGRQAEGRELLGQAAILFADLLPVGHPERLARLAGESASQSSELAD